MQVKEAAAAIKIVSQVFRYQYLLYSTVHSGTEMQQRQHNLPSEGQTAVCSLVRQNESLTFRVLPYFTHSRGW
jgi:hypothetical protein